MHDIVELNIVGVNYIIESCWYIFWQGRESNLMRID